MSKAAEKYDAVFYEAFAEEVKELEKYLPPDKKYLFTWKTIQESGHKFPSAPVISCRTQSRIPPEWADRLTGIVTRSTGYDHITGYLETTGKNIPCAYLPEYAARAVAEQAMMMWTALLRNINSQTQAMKTFHRDNLTGREIAGRTITVIGVGQIGSQIVDLADGLHMNVLGFDLVRNPELAECCNLEYADSLPEALQASDIAVCALSLTNKTRGMIDLELLKNLPEGAIFVNISRGEIVPARNLLHLIQEGHLGGVGLDVFENEKELAAVLRDGAKIENFEEDVRESLEATLQLMEHPRAIMTPHNAFNTMESVERKSRKTAENLMAFRETGNFITPAPSPDAVEKTI